MAEIIQMISNSFDSNVFLILDEKAVLIDAGSGTTDAIFKKVSKSAKIDMIINTHAHIDHCGGDKYFKSAIWAHSKDVNEMRSGRLYGTCYLAGKESPIEVSRAFEEGDKISLGEHVFKVLHTPGHTKGGICLYERRKKILISGDTLFAGGCFGRTDLGGDEGDMLASLKRLSKLDFNLLLPGHGGAVENGSKQAKLSLENAKELLHG
ncbi:MAG: MBL fold metallo-hydrolase [Candidatus Hydrothermarchaeaceae archaeon]